MTLRLATVNLTWDKVTGSSGYDILLDGVKVSNAGSRATSTKIFIPEGEEHLVSVKAQPSGQFQQARFEWHLGGEVFPLNFSSPTKVVTL